jgi:hypothetical protein
LEHFFGESFRVFVQREESMMKTLDFQVLDSKDKSCRNGISTLYVMPLTKQEAKISNAPSFVDFITYANFPQEQPKQIKMKDESHLLTRRKVDNF